MDNLYRHYSPCFCARTVSIDETILNAINGIFSTKGSPECLKRGDPFKGIPVQNQQDKGKTHRHRLAQEGEDEERRARR